VVAITGTKPAAAAEGLNPQQLRAVRHQGGPLVILAGAGTGKTRTLVARLAELIVGGVPPGRILLVTFSRRAADEMVRRAGALTDVGVARQIHAGTFHAIAHRLLRRYGAVVGLADAWSVLDAGDTGELMGLVRAELAAAVGTGAPRRRFPRSATLASIYSRVVNAGTCLADVVATDFPWCLDDVEAIAAIFGAYTDRKRVAGLVDFDDLLLFWRAATEHPTLGPVLAGLYDHVLVDEYQDTNVVQADIVAGLCTTGAGLTVVGDAAQAIYGFRAATARNLTDFAERFAGATTVTLEQNYRSTGPILALANAVVADLAEGGEQRLWTTRRDGRRPTLATCPDEASQADAVCDVILEHYETGIALRHQAVLARASSHTDLLEIELRRRHIPFVKFGGLHFVETAHVRDLVACLRVLDNPWDELAWPRVLGLLEGVGPATTARVTAELGVGRRRRAHDPLSIFIGPDRPRIRTDAGELDELATALADCQAPGLGASEQVERLSRALDPLIRRRYDHAEMRLRDFTAVARSAGRTTSRSALVADLTLSAPRSTGDLAGPPVLDDDWITLSTVHSAKGGEWRVVHVVHAADGMFPSDLATSTPDGIDEERRLFYVALTRARDHLHLYAPLRYHHRGANGRGDRHGWAQRSRFLPPAVEPLLDHRAVRGAPDEVPLGDHAPVVGALDATLRALW